MPAFVRDELGLTLISVVHGDGTVEENPAAKFRIAKTDALYLVGTKGNVEQLEKLSSALAAETGAHIAVPYT